MLQPTANNCEYQIQIGSDQQYPFNGVKPGRFHVSVKQKIQFKKYKNTHEKINKLIEIEDFHAIKILQIVQSHLHENYQIFYQYVPYKINNQCPELKDYFLNKSYHEPLHNLFRHLLEKGIKPIIKPQNFGFNQNLKIKMFVSASFDTIQLTDSLDIENIISNLIYQCDKIFEKQVKISFNSTLKNKLIGISEKMKKINPGQFLKQYTKKPKRQSSSENSDSFAITGHHQQLGNAQWQFDNDFQFTDSYSENDKRKNKKKRSMSFKDSEKTYAVPKQKKASWGEQKSSVIESDRTTVLKKRVTEALLKTQKTLSKYQKIRSKSGKKKRNIGQS